jgi:hypothetical protein
MSCGCYRGRWHGFWPRGLVRSIRIGLELKKKYGVDAVCELSLAIRTSLAPVVGESLSDLAGIAGRPFILDKCPTRLSQVREAQAVR